MQASPDASRILPVTGTSATWATIALFAIPLAVVNAFWVTAERVAVGSFAQAQQPLPTFVALLAAMLPATAAAVVAAMAWCRRRGIERASALAATFMVSAWAVAVGVVGLASLDDYRTQVHDMADMAGMAGDGCGPACQSDLLALSVRATVVLAVVLGVTDVVVVLWARAVRGGATLGWPGSARLPRRLFPSTLPLALALFGAAAIHAAVVPQHVEEWPAAGGFFVILSAVEAGLGAAVLLGTAHTSVAVLVASVGPLAVWGWSRAFGLPWGPDPGVPEVLGVPDLAASLLEVTCIAIVLAGIPSRPRRDSGQADAGRLSAVLAVVAITVLGVVGASPVGVLV